MSPIKIQTKTRPRGNRVHIVIYALYIIFFLQRKSYQTQPCHTQLIYWMNGLFMCILIDRTFLNLIFSQCWKWSFLRLNSFSQWASYQIPKITGCAYAGNAGNVFPATDFKGAASIMRPLSRGRPRDNSAVHGASEDVPGMTYDVPGVSYPIPWTPGGLPPGRPPSGRPRDTQFGIDWSLLPSGCPQGVRTAEVQPITARTHYGQEVGLPTVRPKPEVDVP